MPQALPAVSFCNCSGVLPAAFFSAWTASSLWVGCWLGLAVTLLPSVCSFWSCSGLLLCFSPLAASSDGVVYDRAEREKAGVNDELARLLRRAREMAVLRRRDMCLKLKLMLMLAVEVC